MKKILGRSILLAGLLIALILCSAQAECDYYAAHGDHNWVQKDVTLPSCTANGYIYLECVSCGTQDTVVNPAYGHQWQETWRIEATCQTPGKVVETCVNCGETRTYELAPISHQFVQAGYETPSTCTVQGFRMEECVLCGIIRTIELPLIEHTYGAWVVQTPATDSSAGTRIRTCAVCGFEESHIYYADGTLYRGGPSGIEVMSMQQMLIDLHFLTDAADGSFGAKTEAAVLAYQTAAGLEATGVAFPQTLQRLRADWERASGSTAQLFAGISGGLPYCLRTMENEKMRIDFCQEHAALVQREMELRQNGLNESDAELALKACVQMWSEALDELYQEWDKQLLPENQGLVLKAMEGYHTMLDSMSRRYADDVQNMLLFQLGMLHKQVTSLCGFVRLSVE